MRRLMWFTIGYTAACGLSVWILPEYWIIPLVVLFGVGAIAVLPFRSKVSCRITAVMLLGAVVGFGWFLIFKNVYLNEIESLDGTEQRLSITASGYSRKTDYGTETDGEITLHERTYRVRVYMKKDTSVVPGEVINGIFRLKPTAPTDESEGTYHAGRGIFLLAYQEEEISVSSAKERGLLHYAAILSGAIEATITQCFPHDTVSFAKALLLGKTGDLSYEVDTWLKSSGIRHVVSVSGMHVAILFALIQVATLKKNGLTALLGFPVLLAFAALAGFTPSVNRACIMCALMIVGRLLDKEYDGATSLSFAVLVMLVVNPFSVTSVSLQLSVASVAGIFLFCERISQWLKQKIWNKRMGKWQQKLHHWLTASISVTVSAMIASTPLCALHFGSVSLIGIVTNLLTMWIISLIFYGILAVCGLWTFSSGAAAFLARVISVPIRYVLICSKVLAEFPLAAVYTRSVYVTAWLLFTYFLLAVFFLLRKKPVRLLVGCEILSLLICVTFSWVEPLLHDVQMTVLDVGQGQSILLQSDGRTYIVDCGGDSDTKTADIIAETLISQGIHYVDGIILTHYDRDHAGALSNLLTRIDSAMLILPRMNEPLSVPENGTVCQYLDRDIRLNYGETSLAIYGSDYHGSGNENSLCILFERENCAILITGDRGTLGEQLLMQKVDLPKLNVLVAGHHGAAEATGEALLRATEPETVMISVGAENRYGHPAETTLERLVLTGCQVYRTDHHGTIVYRR